MKNNSFSRLKLAAMLVCFVCACALFTGCGPKTKPASVYGTWKSEFTGGHDSYVITTDTITYESEYTGYPPFTWEGSVVEVTDSYIYIKKSDNKYYCTSYKNLTEESCSFADAYKDGGKDNTDTLDEAKTEFTVENGYYGRYGEYKRQ